MFARKMTLSCIAVCSFITGLSQASGQLLHVQHGTGTSLSQFVGGPTDFQQAVFARRRPRASVVYHFNRHQFVPNIAPQNNVVVVDAGNGYVSPSPQVVVGEATRTDLSTSMPNWAVAKNISQSFMTTGFRRPAILFQTNRRQVLNPLFY